jgi:hypothetical protein
MSATDSRRQAISFTLFGAVLGAAGLLAATSAFGLSARVQSATTAAPSAAAPDPTPITYVGKVGLTPERGVAGTTVALSGSGFQPGASVTVAWNSVAGSWKLDGDAHELFMGRKFTPVRTELASATIDASGTLTASFKAPLDHGFSHDVTIQQGDRLLNKAAFRLDPTVSVAPAAGPTGTPITIRMEGVGWANLENSWMVTYDNQFTGLLSSVTTGGVAVATIPAAGAVGRHVIRVVHGSFTVPYLNMQQSPRPDRPTFTFAYDVTDGPAVAAVAGELQSLAPGKPTPPEGNGPAIWTDSASATVGTPVTVRGRGLAANADLAVTWTTVVGNRVGGNGWDEETNDAFHVRTGADGSFEWKWTVPDDLGGAHRLAAVVGGTIVAQGTLVITPSLVSPSNMTAKLDSELTVHLKGVGWTETANIYNVTYDNGYLGYVCGFNSQGDVVIHLPAAGAIGRHYIDLYPGIYKGKDMDGVQNFRIPQLTAETDHPGERLPIFRIAVDVTE